MTNTFYTAVEPGVIIEGVGRLGNLLSASEESAVYEAESEVAAHRTVVQVRRGDTPDAEHYLALWRERLSLSHPNLLESHAAGRSDLNGVPVIYLVTERADESLAEVLAARPLTEEEATEILQPALSALSYLHGLGYVLGGMEPSGMLAVGDTLKLAADRLSRIENGGAPPEDMWALGAVLARAITGSVQPSDAEAEPYILQGASEPLSGVVRHCLRRDPATRWTAEQALAHLTRGATARAVPVQVTPPANFRMTAPDVPTATEKGGRGRGIYGLAAGAVLLIGLVGWQLMKRSATSGVAPGGVSAPANTPAKTVQTSTADPMPRTEVPAATTRAEKAVSPGQSKQSGAWVVVVASYGARGPAEKRARELRRRWPQFRVETVEAASERARLLVVIGKNLSEKEAETLRKRALNSGLPRDTYIKRINTGNG